jgi:hypothetical protein
MRVTFEALIKRAEKLLRLDEETSEKVWIVGAFGESDRQLCILQAEMIGPESKFPIQGAKFQCAKTVKAR